MPYKQKRANALSLNLSGHSWSKNHVGSFSSGGITVPQKQGKAKNVKSSKLQKMSEPTATSPGKLQGTPRKAAS